MALRTEGIPIPSHENNRDCADQTGGQSSSNNGTADEYLERSRYGSLPEHARRIIEVRGIVQGVGFRPFIYSLAQRYKITGMVRNDPQGAYLEAEGPCANLDQFMHAIRTEAPSVARIESITCHSGVVNGDNTFQIVESRQGNHSSALISPDIAICDQCVRELFEPSDRRYRYPFINCTNCGPRFTITRSVPYDRAMTTMASFPLCSLCQREYDDPADRRFHAQPNACAVCGPHVQLHLPSGQDVSSSTQDSIQRTAKLLLQGAIVALKGLGGYHLCCSALDAAAVSRLRSRKIRYEKPFAVMAQNIDQIRTICEVVPEEESILKDAARPIVLLQWRHKDGVAQDVAPRQQTLGVMLPYTPLHYLLLSDMGIPLVMTSGNRSDEPIAHFDDEAFRNLGDIADFFLVHNRAIHTRCDDSVVRVLGASKPILNPTSNQTNAHSPAAFQLAPPNSPLVKCGEDESRIAPVPGADFTANEPLTKSPFVYSIRRSRGYAPAPLKVVKRFDGHLLACGAELKNTFCVAKDRHAFLSHHIGDLKNYETLCSFRETIEHYCRLFDIQPERVVYDLHPEYLSTKYALELEETGVVAIGIQHHHAHIASCLADNDRPYDERVIGVAFDGTGYGTDGAIWGGEFLEGSIHDGFVRQAHLAYTPMPGGEAAIRQPWRMAVAHLLTCYGLDETLKLPLPMVRRVGERNIRLLDQLIKGNINSPPTSSAGRLFDAVAALLGVAGSEQTAYEGQAAVELELAADGRHHGVYPFCLRDDAPRTSAAGEQEKGLVVDVREVITLIAEDIAAGRPVEEISSIFHQTIVELVAAVCSKLRDRSGVSVVALSGGTFQNMFILNGVVKLLKQRGFVVHYHHRVPATDGGLSLGQAVLANGMAL